MASKRIIRYKCPYCDKRFERRDLVAHVEQKHEDMIPKNYTAMRLVFNYVNKKPLDYNGKCTECGGPTQWDENKGRYDRQCQKKACKESYLRKFEQNMMRTKGVTRISATADGQEKMLANRKISGEYTFQDGTKKTYTGSYERKALEFMDKVMEMDPDDIICPGPVLEYTYEGKTHIYITDFYYQPYNLIIEVKDGGNNPNKRNMPEYRAKQIAKEKFIIQHTNYNYLRLTDNDFSQLLSVFVDLKYEMTENTGERVIHVNEDTDVLENIDEAFNIFDFIIKKSNNQPQISYANDKSRTSSDTFENLGGSLFNQVKLDLDNKQFIIKGINFEKFLLRLKEMYEYRGITKLFEKQYSNFDLKLWKLGLKSKNNMKIHELTIPLYFALEIHNIFMNLGEFYNLNFYKEIARNIYKKTWVSNFENKSEIPRLNTGILNNIFNSKYKLKDYQKTFIEEYNNFKYIYDLDGYILCFEQGLGKTLTSIALAELLGKDQIIIVCPNSLKENWVNEIESYYKIYNDNRSRLVNDVYAHGVSKFTSAKNPKFIIVNQDVIDKIYNVAKKDKDSIIIVDEIHNFRNIDSIRSKMLIKLKEIIDCKDNLLMSGTPIKAEATEIIPMLRMIDPYFTEELALIYKKAFNNNSIQVADVVKSRFSRIIYRKTKDEVLDLPNKNISNLELPCRNSQKYLISEVKAEISKEIKNQIESRKDSVERYKLIFESMVLDYSTAPMKETKDYLKYIANIGSEYVDEDEADYQDLVYKKFLNDYVYPNILDKSERTKFDEARTNYVYFKQSCIGKAIGKILPPANTSCYIDIFNDNLGTFINYIRSSTKKTVIFTPFLEVANHINETLNKKGIGSVKIIGATNDRMDIINSFKNDDTIDVLVATVQTLSTGVTLTEADQMFFFGVPYRKADFDQACDRIHRIGQTKDVSIYVVLLKTTQNNITNRINDIMLKSGESSNSLIYFEGYDYLEESKDALGKYLFLDIQSNKSKVLKYLKDNNQTQAYAQDTIDNYNGEIIVFNNKMIGRILVGNKRDKGFITDFIIDKEYRGNKLGSKLLDDAINKYGGYDLLVDKSNKLAIDMYRKKGFETTKTYGNQYYMVLKNKINESKDVSTLTDGFKNKSGKTFKLVDVDIPEALKYVSEKWRESKNGKTLYIALSEQDDYEIAGYIGWKKSGNIAPLRVYEKFRGYGLSEILLKLAIKNGGYKLGVYSDNEVAIRLYKKFGFVEVDRKTYKDGDVVIIMELKNKINESYVEESKVSKKYYHISQSNLDGKTLQPSIPDNYLTKNNYEDNTTKRVCFSTSIDGCLRGLSQNLKDKEYYVHILDGEYDIYTPNTTEVPDSKITKEVWVTEACNVKCIGKIKVTGDKGEDGLPYTYGSNKTAELYDWDWEWMEQISESVSFDEYHPVYLISMSYKSPLEKPIELFTGSKYAHSCIVIDNDFDHMYSFNGDSKKTLASKFLGGFSAEPLSLFKKINPNGLFTTSVLFVKDKDYEKLQDKLDKYILNQDKTKYNFTGLLNVPIKKETITRENRMFCSQFVDALFKFIGVDITGKSSNLVSPKDIANIQNKKVYNIYSGTIKDFDPRKCIELTKRLSGKADYIKESFEYEIVDEMYTRDEYDIMYNKKIFDNGDINLCFITGHSGSGKSTYAHYLEKKYYPNIEVYELDDVIASYNFSDENLKEYGDMINSFFKKNPKYRIPYQANIEDWIKDNKFTSIPEYSEQVSREFVKYAKNFVKYHSRKYIIEGIQLFCYFKPEEFKDYAFYIKGTSAFKSWIRSAIRDGKDGFKNKWMMLKDYNWYEQQLYKFRDYYAPKDKNYKKEEMDIEESTDIINELMTAAGYSPVVGIEKSDAYIVNYMSNQVFNGEPSEYYRDKIAVTNTRDLHDVVGLDDKQRLRKLKLEEIHNPILYKSGKTNEEVSALMERCMNSVVFKDYVYETITGQRVYGDVESQAAATLDRVEILDREKFFKILKDYLLPTDEIDLEITNLENKIRDIKNNL